MFANSPTPLSDALPNSEKVSPDAGDAAQSARADHAHPRLTSTTIQTLGAGGDVQVIFTRSFTSMPGVLCLAYKPTDNLPVTFEVKSWVQDANNNYTGCVIHGSKAQSLPAVIALLGTLVNYNIFAGNAVGTQFSCVAILASN